MNEVLAMREAAGCSQSELAARSGVAQPNIAAYEAGRRRPSAQMIERLRAALRPRPSQALAEHRAEVLSVLAQFRMSAPRVFGSASRGTDEPGSDLDLLVDVADDADLLDLIDGAAALERVLGVPVDLVTSRSIGPELAHDYDAVDYELVWRVVAVHAAQLRHRVEALVSAP